MRSLYNPYLSVFIVVCIGLVWRPFLIGFYGDDFSLTQTDSFANAFIYGEGRRERLFYVVPIAIPRYLFGHNAIGWGVYSVIVSGLTAVAVFSFFKSVINQLSGLEKAAIPAAMLASVLFIFMPWSLTPVLWNTSISLLAMVALLALAGTAMLSGLALWVRTILFVGLFSSASLIYESIWCAWIPLLLIKLTLDAPSQRKETGYIAAFSFAAQIALVANYIPSYGMQGRVKLGGDLAIGYKLNLFVENILIRFPFEVISSMGVIGLVAIPFVIFTAYWLFKNKAHYASQKYWFTMASCLTGIVGGIFIISIGNYRVAGTTEDARTLFVVSFWLALMIALVASVLITKEEWRLPRIASILVCIMIVGAFFLRSSDWVRGYQFQRQVIAFVPAEKIARLAEGIDKPVLLVEFDTPMHLFHGMHNNRGTNFLSEEIRKQTRKSFFVFPANGRIFGTVLDGTHLYQPNCITHEMVADYAGIYEPSTLIFWHVGTGKVSKITSPFDYGCTRPIHRYEFLGELLYPFMGNPRRF